MPAAHVFNVPQPYRNKDEPAEPPREKRSRFRWFGHSVRLGSSKQLSHAAPPSSTVSVPSRRTKSSYSASEDEYSPATSPRAASKSLTSESDLQRVNTQHTSLLKFGLLRRHNHHTDSHSSLRSSIASTASTSTTTSDDLSPPSSTASFASTTTPFSPADDELRSPRMEYETRAVLRDVVGVDATWIDDAHVARHYESLHWRVVRIEADGNCLFRAVSDQIYRNEAFYGDIRRRVVAYIEREKELFQPFVENEQTGRFEPIDAYCTRMKQDAQWGGNPELYAVARLFNVHIVVHQGPMRRLRIENGRADAPDLEMQLLFRNDHYDSLHDKAQLDTKPRLSATVADDLLEPFVAAEDTPRVECLENQQQDESRSENDKKTKKKKKKCVVFIGEQTRVERVEVAPPPVVMYAPTRLVVRGGKVRTHEESMKEDTPLAPPEEDDDDEAAVADNQESDERPMADPTSRPSNNQDGELQVVRVQRVNFRRGRRVAV